MDLTNSTTSSHCKHMAARVIWPDLIFCLLQDGVGMGHEALPMQKIKAVFEPTSILRRPEVILGCHCSKTILYQAEASCLMILVDVLGEAVTWHCDASYSCASMRVMA